MKNKKKLKTFQKLLIIFAIILTMVLPLLPEKKVEALHELDGYGLWALMGHEKVYVGAGKGANGGKWVWGPYRGSSGPIKNIATYEDIMQWSPSELRNTSFNDQGGWKIAGVKWWEKTNNVLCMNPTNNDSGMGIGAKGYIVIDINKSGAEPDKAEVYVNGSLAGSGNDKKNAELAYICTALNNDHTCLVSCYEPKKTFNNWWTNNCSYYSSIAGTTFANAGFFSNNYNNILGEAQNYGNNYKSAETQYQARVVIFGGGGEQRRGCVFGQECEGGVTIDKYITKTDPATTTNLSDRAGKDDDWKYENAVKVSEKDTKITYHIVLENPGDSEVEVEFQDDYSGGSGGNCLDYVSCSLSGVTNDSSQRKLSANSIKIPAKSKKEFDIVLKYDGSKVSGKYKNIAKVKLKTSKDWIESSDTIQIKVSEPEIKKYITSISNGGDLKGDRKSFTEDQKRATPAEAETKIEHTVTYSIEIKNNSDKEISGTFTDQISPSLPLSTSVTNGGTITIPAKTTYKITVTATVSASAWATTYTNTAKFGYNGKEYISIDVFKLKEKPEPQVPSGTLKKYISEAHSTFGNREEWSTDEKYDTPAESAHGETVTYTIKFKVSGLYYENTCGTDESGAQWDRYTNELKDKSGNVDIIFTDWYDEGLEWAGGYIESPGQNGGLQYSYQGSDGVSTIDGVTNVKKSQITLKDCKMNKTGETEIVAKLTFRVSASDMRLPNLQNKMGEVKYSYTRYDSYWTPRYYQDGTYRVYYYDKDGNVTGYRDFPKMVHDYNDGTWNPGASTIGPALLPGTENDFGFDYVRILDPYVGGYVWIDDGDGIRSSSEGGLNGSNITSEVEKPTFANINVKLWKSTGEFVAQTVTSNGHYSFGRVRKGTTMEGPEAGGLENTYANFGENHRFHYQSASLITYFITFEYNGERYKSAINDSEASIEKEKNISDYQTVLGIDSDAGEENDARTWFNESLETISHDAAWPDNGASHKPLAYDKEGNSLQKSTLKWDGSALEGGASDYDSYYNGESYFKGSYGPNRSITMIVKTPNLYFSENFTEDQYTGGAMYAQNIDLGIVERLNDTNLSLEKDVVKAEVTINNHITTYTYEHLGDSDYTVTASNTINTPYVLKVYREDYEYRTNKYSNDIQTILNTNNKAILNDSNRNQALDRGNDLEILITYKITVKNNSTSADAVLREIVDYTTEMQVKQVIADNLDTGEILNFGVTNYTEAVYNPGSHEYKVYINTNAAKIGVGEKKVVYVKCLVDKDDDGYIIKDKMSTTHNTEQGNSDTNDLGKLNIGEISSYSLYERGTSTPIGLVDQDSNPGNADPTDPTKNEDDTFNASLLVILRDEDGEEDGKKKDYRNISGIVFEEIDKPNETDGQMLGDGKMEYTGNPDNDSDIPADGVLVKLYEVVTEYPDDDPEHPVDYYVDTGLWYRTWVDKDIYDLNGNKIKEGNPNNPENGRYYFGDGSDVASGNSHSNESGLYGESTDDKYKLHPAIYTVRFIYGDERDYLVTKDGNIIKYSGQDFQSTVYTDPEDHAPNQEPNEVKNEGNKETNIVKASLFAKLSKNDTFFDGSNPSIASDHGGTIYSVAKDNEIRRLEVNSYSTTTTYLMDSVLKANNKLGLVDPSLSEADQEIAKKKQNLPDEPYKISDTVQEANLLADHTVMFADSKLFDIDVEYYTNYEDKEKYILSGDFKDFTKYYYAVRDLNFGMAERPKTKLQLMNDIAEIEAVTSDGKVLVDMVFDVIYEPGEFENGSYKEIIHKSVINYEKTTGWQEVQVLNRRDFNQGFRYINIDTDILQGLVITVKYRVAVANISEIDHIDKDFQKEMQTDLSVANEEGLLTELEVEYDTEASGESTEQSGNIIKDIINIVRKKTKGADAGNDVKRSQTRTYDYSNNKLYSKVKEFDGAGTEVKKYDSSGFSAPQGPEQTQKIYTYRNIRKNAASDYELGKYLGTIYFTGESNGNEAIVETKIDQFINYVDSDLVFKPEENVDSKGISQDTIDEILNGKTDEEIAANENWQRLQNGQIAYLTYNTKEISERGLLKNVIYDLKRNPTTNEIIEDYSSVLVITDGKTDYYNEEKPNVNNNLAFNIEEKPIELDYAYGDDGKVKIGVYKYLKPITNEAFETISDIEHTIPGRPDSDDGSGNNYYDYIDEGTERGKYTNENKDSIGNPYKEDDVNYSYDLQLNKYLYVMNLEASKMLASESDAEGLEIDNIAEIVKTTNTVGRKVYVKSGTDAEAAISDPEVQDPTGYIGNTTITPIEKIHTSEGKIVIVAKSESDTDFTEFVTLSPPTGLTVQEVIIKNWADNPALIIVPSIVIVVGSIYVIVQFMKRKKFYK